jgi:hypothetical protein
VRATGRARTTEARALAARTAKHFAHKVPVEEVDGVQRIETRFGSIELAAGESELIVSLDGEEIDELRRVAVTHLARFARDEPFDVRWDES